ncbi:hypothetical protein F-LCD7_0230 [Faustovirus]|nr:hypothetical protein F-LCD7_0230 [Faustovirus]
MNLILLIAAIGFAGLILPTVFYYIKKYLEEDKNYYKLMHVLTKKLMLSDIKFKRVNEENITKGMILHRSFIGSYATHAGVLYRVDTDNIYDSIVIEVNGDTKDDTAIREVKLSEFLKGESIENNLFYDIIDPTAADNAKLQVGKNFKYSIWLNNHCWTFAYRCVNEKLTNSVLQDLNKKIIFDTIEILLNTIIDTDSDSMIHNQFEEFIKSNEEHEINRKYLLIKKSIEEIKYLTGSEDTQEVFEIPENFEVYNELSPECFLWDYCGLLDNADDYKSFLAIFEEEKNKF